MSEVFNAFLNEIKAPAGHWLNSKKNENITYLFELLCYWMEHKWFGRLELVLILQFSVKLFHGLRTEHINCIKLSSWSKIKKKPELFWIYFKWCSKYFSIHLCNNLKYFCLKNSFRSFILAQGRTRAYKNI